MFILRKTMLTLTTSSNRLKLYEQIITDIETNKYLPEIRRSILQKYVLSVDLTHGGVILPSVIKQ